MVRGAGLKMSSILIVSPLLASPRGGRVWASLSSKSSSTTGTGRFRFPPMTYYVFVWASSLSSRACG